MDNAAAHVTPGALTDKGDVSKKEKDFFGDPSMWRRGRNWYEKIWPNCPRTAAGQQLPQSAYVAIDATPAYLRKPIVADRLVEVLPRNAVPKLRFVVILRDPVDRLYAYWDAFVLSGVGVNRFEAWADKTMENVLACQKRVGSNELWPPPDTGVCDEDTVEGVAAGLYAYQLIYWLHRFDPKQFLVTTIDAYERDPQRVVRDVAGHVGASTTLAGAVRAASDPTAVKVMGGMTADARRKAAASAATHPTPHATKAAARVRRTWFRSSAAARVHLQHVVSATRWLCAVSSRATKERVALPRSFRRLSCMASYIAS